MSEYIGRYRVVRPLGEGGMGRVLLAEVVASGGFTRLVVIKLVRDELDESLKTALLEEARVTATLVHRNIVPVLDLHESGAQRLVVLEYIDGMDLGQLIKRAPMVPWPLAAFIGGEVAAALDFAHRRQVIHRDVSPANILLSFEGEVKLADFGVAKVVGGPMRRRVGPTQGLKGKLGYMAPEQMARDPVDARADIYSLGVVMYEMLLGSNPMRGKPRKPPPLPPSVPRELAEVVLRAVSYAKEERFASAADMREAILHVPGQPADPARRLADFLQELRPRNVDEGLLAAVIGSRSGTARAGQRGAGHWRWVAAAGLMLAVAATVGLAIAWRARAHPATKATPIATTATGKTPLAAPPAKTLVAAPPGKMTELLEPGPAPSLAAPPVAAPPPTPAPVESEPTFTPERVHHKRRPRGALSVNAIPWANVFIDGRASGHTPRRHITLEAGRHHLRLVTQAGEARTRTVEIAPDRETKLTVVFSEP